MHQQDSEDPSLPAATDVGGGTVRKQLNGSEHPGRQLHWPPFADSSRVILSPADCIRIALGHKGPRAAWSRDPQSNCNRSPSR